MKGEYVVRRTAGFSRRALCYRCRSYILFRTRVFIIRTTVVLNPDTVLCAHNERLGVLFILNFGTKRTEFARTESTRNKMHSPDNSRRLGTCFAGS